MHVHILADSGSDLPLSFFEHKNTSFIPLRVQLGNKDYEDLKEIEPIEVYHYMREGKVVKTSQASPETIRNRFLELAKQNKPSLYIAFSSELSGTYQTAMMIRQEVLEEYPDFPLEIIDSKCASLGYGLAVQFALKLSEQGQSLQEMSSSVKEYCQHMEHIFTVDQLDYLLRGGRISKTQAFIGGLLNIKPLLHVDKGRLIPLEKVRGKKKLYRRIIELMEERGDDFKEKTLAISHGDDLEAVEELKKMIEDHFQPKEVYVNIIGSAIGAHSGPGTLAVFFLNSSFHHELL
ncbi:DegV family protein [Bacillus alveayuensis]|uniref:DegV family protein with EDD domain n=1 Tax=Aeribacillus alveayuensis TaxID=279215 RepID=A0ABT9VN61_9BACI|nr:DegV family protein [Bacillus alveayuensis]MDQ0162408.1 DegV family protein with EDD domain [Bacillus alveayuensis]